MDSAYWSLVIEVTFYAWVYILIATGLFPRRIDLIVLAWLCLSMLNELTIDARIVENIFLADDAGYFSAGLMIYEIYRGRRDPMVFGILGLATGVSVFHAIHSLAWLRSHSGTTFDAWIVAAICLGSIVTIFLATRITRLPLPPALVIAAGGITYPLYLLHQQIGYTILTRIAPAHHIPLAVIAVLLGVVLLSWAIWKYVEPPLRNTTKGVLTGWAVRIGLRARPRMVDNA